MRGVPLYLYRVLTDCSTGALACVIAVVRSGGFQRGENWGDSQPVAGGPGTHSEPGEF